jgi:hypothetical protein
MTPDYACPACDAKRIHDLDEWMRFHPYSKHGYTSESGWSHADLKPKDEKQQ